MAALDDGHFTSRRNIFFFITRCIFLKITCYLLFSKINLFIQGLEELFRGGLCFKSLFTKRAVGFSTG